MEPFKPLTVCATDSRTNLLDDSLAVSPDIASERNAFREQAASQIFLMFWQHALVLDSERATVALVRPTHI